VTWQIASGSSISQRQKLRNIGCTEQDIFQLACENMKTISLIGLQDRLDDFSKGLALRFGVTLNIQ
jgi:hypothetical protein